MQPQELLDTLIKDIEQVAKTETIVGEPMTVGANTVIPVVRLSVGFGAGGGEGRGTDAKTNTEGGGTGGGAGGGIRIEPAAFIVSRGDELSVMAAPGKSGRLAEAFEHVPELIAKFVASKQAKDGKNESAKKDEKG